MKKFITMAILVLVSFSTFAQYNTDYVPVLEEPGDYILEQATKGQALLASGGITLGTTLVFDCVYYGILSGTYNRKNVNVHGMKTATVVGAVISSAGLIAGIVQFATGHSLIKKTGSLVYFNENGALCVKIPDKRTRHW